MKKILFTINTLGRAGAETALLELLKRLEPYGYEVYLYVMMNQGELIKEVPSYVHILNSSYNSESVLSNAGRRHMVATVIKSFLRNGGCLRKLRHLHNAYKSMKKRGIIQKDKLFWRVIADGAIQFDQNFDLAIAWIEGASAYYTADHVNAAEKVAFIHVDYKSAGYTREMDMDSFEQYSRIFAVSEETRQHFLEVYPQYEKRTDVFHNFLDREGIQKKAQTGIGFTDNYRGQRLLTVGRLTYQKGYDIAVAAMKILIDSGVDCRWYILGEGPERKALEKRIVQLGIEEHFILLGTVDNPYPFYLESDIYVHATRFEGKSLAIQEAQILGCPTVATNCPGNREQIKDGVNGVLCDLTPEAVAESIQSLIQNTTMKKRLGDTAESMYNEHENEIDELLKSLS